MSKIERYLFADHRDDIHMLDILARSREDRIKLVTESNFADLQKAYQLGPFKRVWVHFGLGPDKNEELERFYRLLQDFYKQGGLIITTNTLDHGSLAIINSELECNGIGNTPVVSSAEAMEEAQDLIMNL